jgi:large conductance mechanosensitive channel
MLDDFKQFIMRGNVLDMAVGLIIGVAFKDIVSSLVNDIIMPPIGLILGGVDFSNIFITLQEASGETEAVTMNIGVFINTVIEFLIIAFVIFMIVRAVNNMMAGEEEAPEPEAPAEPTTEEKLLDAIQELTAAVKAQK